MAISTFRTLPPRVYTWSPQRDRDWRSRPDHACGWRNGWGPAL